jgi:voltage-gated potassium channel
LYFRQGAHHRQKDPRATRISVLTAFITTLKQERIFFLIGGVLIVVLVSALGFAVTEHTGENFGSRLLQGAWWAAVTITTVGYGDVVPRTWGGRLIGVGLMLSGVILLSLTTATIASIFIERKIRRERGLESIAAHDHIIILGWHSRGPQILKTLFYRIDRRTAVILINNLPPEQFETIKNEFEGHPLLYIRGDFTREEVLLKADLGQARRAVILADRVDNPPREQVDQRTLLAALALKSLNPKIEVCAEILYQDNRPHLERAHVEDIILRGEYDSALIASATESAGLFKVLQTLLSPEGPNFYALEIPARFQGASLKTFAAHLKERQQALLIGVFTEGQRLKLEDLLSGEHSAIDEFIYRKFNEAGKAHLFGLHQVDFLINPPDDHVLSPREVAVVIASEQPRHHRAGRAS